MTMIERMAGIARPAMRGLDSAAPVADLLLRLWVARIFFQSGLVKAQSMETTRMLFAYEYEVLW